MLAFTTSRITVAAVVSRSRGRTHEKRRTTARKVPKLIAIKDVYFDFDKSNIRPGDAKILDASATYLKANPDQLVLIEGHCDERGTIEYTSAGRKPR